MPIPLVSDHDLDAHFAALGLAAGHHVCVHSRLISRGRLPHGAASVLAALQRAVGETGTIAVPAYSFGIGESDIFDPRTTPPQDMGSLSDHVWSLGRATRSPCPIHSHLAMGAKAHLLAGVSGADSVGAGSDFALFRSEGFRLLMLGLSFTTGASYMHHVEDVEAVPYRGELALKRLRRDADGSVTPMVVRYYGYPSHEVRGGRRSWIENYDVVESRMAEDGSLIRVPCPFIGHSSYCSLEDAHRTASAMVAADPYCMVLRNSG